MSIYAQPCKKRSLSREEFSKEFIRPVRDRRDELESLRRRSMPIMRRIGDKIAKPKQNRMSAYSDYIWDIVTMDTPLYCIAVDLTIILQDSGNTVTILPGFAEHIRHTLEVTDAEISRIDALIRGIRAEMRVGRQAA